MLEDFPAPQRLALAYATARSRPAILALLGLDIRLGQVLQGHREPIATQLRLAWWRDMLGRPSHEWPRGEPLLDALRSWHEPVALAALPGAWETLLLEILTPQAIAEFAEGRGQAFAALARELGGERVADAAVAGEIWALADLAANLSDGAERSLVVALGRSRGAPPVLSRPLRPLAVLAGLGAAALARGGGKLLDGPAGMLLALRIGLIGR